MKPGILGHSIHSACEIIPCGRTKLYQLIAAGRLTARKLGKKTIITHSSLVEMIDSLPAADIGRATKGGDP